MNWGRFGFFMWDGRNLFEQLNGILEEVGVLLESLGRLLENRWYPW